MKNVNCDIETFIKNTKDMNVVCFGIGKHLLTFLDFCKNLKIDFVDAIDYFCDNNSEKWNTVIKLECLDGRQKNIKVLSPTNLCTLKNKVIVISCTYITSIINQLNEYADLKDTYCYTTRFMLGETNEIIERKREYPKNYKLSEKQLIPKKIHYCWFGHNPIPEKYKIWMKSWKKYCPDYEIIEWNESNYDFTKNKYMHQAYLAQKWGIVPDYARLDIIYNEGGIYLDTDVEILKNMDHLLYQKAFAGVDGSKRISLGLGFGGEKGSLIFKDLLNLYENREFINENGIPIMVAAPEVEKNYYTKQGFKMNGDYQIINGMTVYPEKIMSAKSYFSLQMLPNEHSVAAHHYSGSWVDLEKIQKRDQAIDLFF